MNFNSTAANDFVVTNTNDSGEGSLRQAILNANASAGADTITFAGSVFTDATPDVITLTTGQLTLSDDTTILGTGANNLTLSGNNASRVFEINSGVSATLNDLTITNGNGGAYGGGINNMGVLTLNGSALTGNQADRGGGIVNSGTVTLLDSTVNNNFAAVKGGGIYNGTTGVLALSNSTVSGNSSVNDGGGIFNSSDFSSGGDVTVNNSTLTGNSSSTNGDGIWSSGRVTVNNSIWAGNSAPTGSEVFLYTDTGGTFTSGGYNLVGQNGNAGGFSTVATDIVLQGAIGTAIQPLGDNGGSTQTHALADGSPAVNAGNNVGAPATDQRGFSRIVGGNIDIGAVESSFESTNDFVVTNTNDSGEGSLRQAILNANASAGADTITFAGSVFTDATPDVITLTTGQLTLSDDTTILGTGANNLTISGNNASRLFEINSGVSATLNDLTIASGNAGLAFGGGINNQGNLTLNNSSLNSNYANTQGAAIWNNSILTVNNSTFTGNSTDTYNGPGGGGAGGGIFNSGGTVVVNNSTFTEAAVRDGGGIFNDNGGNLTVNSSTFSNSQSNGGGGIFNALGTTTINNSTISGNQAYGWGAGLWNASGSTMILSNSTVSGNSSGVGGGGIWNEGGNLTIGNSTITNNSTGSYGIWSSGGGGIWSNGVVNVSNSIVAGNSAGLGAEVNNADGTFTSGGYNLVGQNGNAGGFSTVATDIVLQGAIDTTIQPLANNGGPTQTHALADGSPAMNAGNNALIPISTTTDQRGTGFDRLLGGTVDIGAVESLAQSGQGGNKTFAIDQGSGTFTITDFTGVGKGNNPSTAIRAEADTIQFTGADLTADKMLLNQVGANLEITFEDVANTKVVLQNFALENLDNLTQATGANVDLANILFNGQTTPQESFDVVNANFTANRLSHRNSVTFLNDLDNSVNGFNNSDDVINGQGGNDILNGLSGDDWLRGGAGSDTLIGGRGNDILVGGQGADYFSFGVGGDVQHFRALGVDTITDFNLLEGDQMVLSMGTFGALTSPAGSGLVASDFATVTSDLAAASSSARIVYNSSNGNLFYNPNDNASGFGVGGQFAHLSNTPQLDTTAFLVQV